MLHIEHPDITKINRHGHLGTAVADRPAHTCKHCGVLLEPGIEIIKMNDHIFCDEECLTQAFIDDPMNYGAEVAELA